MMKALTKLGKVSLLLMAAMVLMPAMDAAAFGRVHRAKVVKTVTVVKPRAGVVVKELPAGHVVVKRRGVSYFYHDGVYYRTELRGGKRVFVVIELKQTRLKE